MTLAQMFTSILPTVQFTLAEHTAKAAMTGVMEEFQEQRRSEFLELAQKSGARGAQLAECQRQLNDWRSYARELEKKCMACGCELPRAPDE